MPPIPATPSPNSGTKIPEVILTRLSELEKSFLIDDDLLNKILDHFITEFGIGLGKYGEPMAMVPTYVTGVPTGKEIGLVLPLHSDLASHTDVYDRTFLALDLGGTNL